MNSSDYSITETIPVADHVFRYLVHKYGSDTIIAERSDIVGSIILSSLNRNNDLGISKKKYSKSIKVVIKDYQYLKNGVFVSVKKGQVFNKIIDKMFRGELYSHCFINKKLHDDAYIKIIRQFLDIYNISEDELKVASIYRDFKRKKQEKEAISNTKVA
ncbi:hypothetical protein [Tenacibaculum soleae]|uniref:hypothetical protein n=1 Tax=Tenacibaculum soleae TaxID=447689 RepID=UPI0026E27757|nr:hypothetical protein [Tenacibaculum soleae]MDO6813808.1 hypothetical protein [Tenacibaculum soleae]